MKNFLFIFVCQFFVIFSLFAKKNDKTFVMQESSEQKTEAKSYSIEKRVVVEKDSIKLVLDSDTGSFGIFALPEKGNPIPVISKNDSSSASYFVLKAGRKVYKLSKSTGIKTEARKTPLGAQMAYLIPDVAQVVVDFSFLASIPNSTRMDMLRVTVYTISLCKSVQSFAIKSVFDTHLGENSIAHFSTAANSKINCETKFVSMKDDLWIRSSNDKATIQFLLDGLGISKPHSVALAGKDVLASSSWEPSIHTGKSFNSVTSYNNSALGINWDVVYLDPLKTSSIGFFISISTDGDLPAGKKFLADLAENKTMLGIYSKDVAVTTNIAPRPILMSPEEAGIHDSEIEKDNVEVSQEQLDPEYIQNLLDYIATLQENGDTDSEELARLNSELDSIFAVLGVNR